MDTQLENTLGSNYQKKLSDGHVSTLSYICNKLESLSKIRRKIILRFFSHKIYFDLSLFHTIPIDRKSVNLTYWTHGDAYLFNNIFIYILFERHFNVYCRSLKIICKKITLIFINLIIINLIVVHNFMKFKMLLNIVRIKKILQNQSKTQNKIE